MSDELTSALKDVGLNANLRPNSLDVRGQQPNLFPTDAFEFDDPNRNDSPVLSMKEPWSLDIGQINFDDLESSLSGTLEDNLLKVEEHSDLIKKVDRGLNLTSQTVYENGITAEASIELATGVREDVDDIADDGIISPSEKLEAKRSWELTEEEYPTILSNATDDGVDTTAIEAAYAELDTYLNTTLSVFDDMSTSTDIDRDEWNSKWNTYYGDKDIVIFASVTIKAEIRDSSGDAVSGAYLTVRADYPVGGGEATSYIEFNADQIRFGGSGLGLDDITEDDGTEVFIKGDLKIESDDSSRLIHLGSAGMYAEDVNGVVIHDLPQEASTEAGIYAGHLFFDTSSASVSNTLYSNFSVNGGDSETFYFDLPYKDCKAMLVTAEAVANVALFQPLECDFYPDSSKDVHASEFWIYGVYGYPSAPSYTTKNESKEILIGVTYDPISTNEYRHSCYVEFSNIVSGTSIVSLIRKGVYK